MALSGERSDVISRVHETRARPTQTQGMTAVWLDAE
jgi:hypothetical protein